MRDNFDEAQILLRRENLARGVVKSRRSDRFHKELRHLACGIAIDGAIHADDTAERRHRIAFERSPVSFGERIRNRSAARIGVLDDCANWAVKLLGQVPRGLQVDDIVVTEFLALKLFAIRNTFS